MTKKQLTEYADFLLHLALKKCGNFEQAEDLVSETLISTYAALEDGREIENPKAYLSGVLNHKFNDGLRSKYAKPTISYGVVPKFDFASKEESTLDKIIRKEDEENIRNCIAILSKNYREVLVKHFIHGKNVNQIATELGLNVNTVKSRMNTARQNVKTEMEKIEMEKFEKQSYEPESLNIWVYGELEERCSAFYTNDWTRRIQQNILILAYKKPVTITELSKAIGIAAAYVEPIVEELISYDFMARVGDKVYTTFLIFSQEEKFKAYDNDKAVAEKYAAKMWPKLEEYLEQIRQKDYYKKMNERQQASLIQFCAIYMIQEATREVKAKKFEKPDVMSIKHKSGWQGYAYGFAQPLEYEPDWDYVKGHDLCKLNGCHVVSTGFYKGLKDLQFMAYDVVAGFTWSQFFPLSGTQFLKVAYALYKEEEVDIPLIAPQFFDLEVIERYQKYNFIGKVPDPENPDDENSKIIVLNLPVLEDEESTELFETIIHNGIRDFAETFHSELEELLVNPVEPPKHLKEMVPESLKYQLCADAFVMSLVYTACWNGYYKSRYKIGGEWVPAMIICPGAKFDSEYQLQG